MTTTEIIKFNVLLVENDQAKAEQLISALGRDNYDIIHVNHGQLSLLQQVKKQSPDILILDIESPERDAIDSLTLINNTNSKSIDMFSQQDDKEVIHNLVRAGVSAYICGSVDSQRVGALLNTAMARFNEHQQLNINCDKNHQLFIDKKLIEQAKEWFMKRKGITAEEAYNAIGKMALRNNQNIDEVAKNIITVAKMLDNSLC